MPSSSNRCNPLQGLVRAIDCTIKQLNIMTEIIIFIPVLTVEWHQRPGDDEMRSSLSTNAKAIDC